jgi:hypothetical protein
MALAVVYERLTTSNDPPIIPSMMETHKLLKITLGKRVYTVDDPLPTWEQKEPLDDDDYEIRCTKCGIPYLEPVGIHDYSPGYPVSKLIGVNCN